MCGTLGVLHKCNHGLIVILLVLYNCIHAHYSFLLTCCVTQVHSGHIVV